MGNVLAVLSPFEFNYVTRLGGVGGCRGQLGRDAHRHQHSTAIGYNVAVLNGGAAMKHHVIWTGCYAFNTYTIKLNK